MIAGVKNSLRHLFLPHESNNHRAKFLHLQSLLLTVVLLIFASFVLSEVRTVSPQILGVTHNISTEELFLLTNQKRLENNATSLVLNEHLSLAAQRKADDMFAKDYWAHNAPDGTTPWVFIKGAGYNYVYAGENLARGYSSASEVVDAWMASNAGHKENLLSGNYKEIGFAVKTGTLGGEETVLVVQEFGGRTVAPLAQNSKPASPEVPQVVKETSSVLGEPQSPIEELVGGASSLKASPMFNSISLTSNISTLIVFFFITVLVIDMIVIQRRKVVRFVGHNLDHVLFLIIVLGLIVVLSKGSII